ncbi:Peptidase S9, prolyl oligopeptidase active domain protein [Hoyosella subflava DQS3-9A1]|uniref:Peptidase S9, prolyl oligopeptidase active domain protein n=1 Tax=Hoyosella subflava (strain DSM 45089 / JCM 17490 / NBRC 109087 / DQS3-9A1) TaxID=443218 RepID=F6EQT3_HOYSD|nr:Peptidase S9, prolyl oligopeptidase active domain protein [Hoyosella subflava DQS3-9A1]
MGRDKASLPWERSTFLAAVVEAVRPVCADVFVVAAPRQTVPEVNAIVVRDPVAHHGPLQGLITGLEAAEKGGHVWAFVCATDMPLIETKLVTLLAQRCQADGPDAVLAHDGDRPQPLAGVYRVSVLQKARSYAVGGRRSLYGFLDTLTTVSVDVSARARQLINVNTPGELAGLHGSKEKKTVSHGNNDSVTDTAASAFHSLDEYLRIPRVSGLVISPDGARLVTRVEQIDDEATKFIGALWEVDPGGKRRARQITAGPKGDAAPIFTTDGDLLFVSARGKDDDAPASLWCLPARGGEAYEIANPPGGVSSALAATDADRVVFTASTYPHTATDDDDAKLRKLRKESKVNAIVHTSYPVRYWDHDLGPEVPELRSGPASGEFTRIAAGPGLREARADLSADGSFLVSTWQIAGPLARQRTQLVRIDAVSGERSILVDETDADFGAPAISPDCNLVAYVREAHGDPETPPQVTLHIHDLTTGKNTRVAQGWERWPTSIRWLPNGNSLVVTADHYSRCPIFLVPVATQGKVQQLTDDDWAYSDVVVAPEGNAVYALRAAISRPPHPVRVELSTGEVSELLGPVAEAPPVPGALTEVMTTAEDGTPLRAWLAQPSDASETNPAPLLVWIHGGPLNSWNSWQWRWNPWLMVARGYAVLLPDPALSTGFGQEFIQRGWGRWGQEPYTDIMALTDAAEQRPEIDAARTAAMGGSFGGYMANWIAGHTDRFKAIVTHASLWALDQFGPTTDAAWFWAREMTPEMAVENSPHLYVADIRTPMLVIHGDKDYRVPIGEALRLWYELNAESALPADDHGVSDHQFLYFPSENHWILSPPHAKIWYQTVSAFLARNVLGKAEPWPEALGAGDFPGVSDED